MLDHESKTENNEGLLEIRLVKPRNAPFKLLDLSKALKDINEGISEATKGKTKEGDGMEAKSFCDIVSLKTGCIDIWVQIGAALLPAAISGILKLFEKGKSKFAERRKIKADDGTEVTQILVIYGAPIRSSSYGYDDDLEIATKAIETYVVKKAHVSLADFIASLSLSKKYGFGSLRMKLSNIVWVLEDMGYAHTAPVGPLDNASHATEMAVMVALIKFGLDNW